MILRKKFTSFIYNTLLKMGIEVKKAPPMAVHKKGNDIIFHIGDIPLKAPSDHALPFLLQKYPDYAWSLGRLAGLMKKKYPHLTVLDVGANIGDSTAIIRNYADAQIACIEGYPAYYKYLSENTGINQNVHAFQLFLDEKEGKHKVATEENQGTIRILPEHGSLAISTTTLDIFLQGHHEYNNAQLLKIDADGYDFRIMRGGLQYIRKTKPVVYFEYAKFYFSQFGENGLKMLAMLQKSGYETAVLYDNFGRLLFSTDMQNTRLLKQLDGYLTHGAGAFSYIDIVLFHKKDRSLAKQFVTEEEQRYDKTQNRP